MALVDKPIEEEFNTEQSLIPEEAVLDAGVVNEPEGELPDEGVESVKDDVSTNAKEGDFILPYESVLFYGFEKINDMVKNSIDQLGEGIDLENVEEGSEIPIQISNFEYRIPKALVPIIGEEELESIRAKGIEFRDQLESVRNDGFMERESPSPEMDMPMPEMAEAPPPPQAPLAPPMPPPQAPPMPPPQAPPMMQTGGYVPTRGLGVPHQPEYHDPLKPPTRIIEQETLDMRNGGLVKKKLIMN